MDYERYHPLTIFLDIVDLIKNMFFIFFILYVLNYGSERTIMVYGRIVFWLVFFIAIIMLFLKWFSNEYRIDKQAFHLREGIFSKKERTVYFNRVQNVQRHRSFFHRIFKMTSLSFQTAASGPDSSVEFKALTEAEANRLQALLETKTTHHEEEAQLKVGDQERLGLSEPTLHFSPTFTDVLKASFTSLSFLVLIALLASIASKLENIIKVEELLEGWLQKLLTSNWLMAGLALLLIMISFLVGLAWTYIKYGKYEISSDQERIYIVKGVLNETDFSILKSRVQGVEISQSFMKRILRLAEVKLVSSGDLGDDEASVSSLYPFLPKQTAYKIIEEILPDFRVEEKMDGLPLRSLFVKLIRPYWFWLIATSALYYFREDLFTKDKVWWLVAILLLVLTVINRLTDFLGSRYIINNNLIQVGQGLFSRTIFITNRRKITELGIERSKLQQITGLASISFINRGQPVRHERISDIAESGAVNISQWFIKR